MAGVRHPLDAETTTERSRLSRALGQLPSPGYLWFLGLLSLPSIFFGRLHQLYPFVLLFLFGFWPWISGLISWVRDNEPPDPTEWLDWGDGSYETRAAVGSILVAFQPYVLVAGLRQLLGTVVVAIRYRGRFPSPEQFEQSVDYRLPFGGEWTVINGSPDRRFSHSWSIPGQRYAYDFVVTDEEGRTHDGEREGPASHYCFDKPILAPADGTVVAVGRHHHDYHRTDGWLDPRQRDLRGNFVTIHHATGEYSVLAHLKQESVTVEEGQQVRAGEEVGRCGHSGNSTEPHLHFQLQDRPGFFSAMGLPIQFSNVSTRFPEEEAEHHGQAYVHAGQLVSHAGE